MFYPGLTSVRRLVLETAAQKSQVVADYNK
jgi:hypothetical protein